MCPWPLKHLTVKYVLKYQHNNEQQVHSWRIKSIYVHPKLRLYKDQLIRHLHSLPLVKIQVIINLEILEDRRCQWLRCRRMPWVLFLKVRMLNSANQITKLQFHHNLQNRSLCKSKCPLLKAILRSISKWVMHRVLFSIQKKLNPRFKRILILFKAKNP